MLEKVLIAVAAAVVAPLAGRVVQEIIWPRLKEIARSLGAELPGKDDTPNRRDD